MRYQYLRLHAPEPEPKRPIAFDNFEPDLGPNPGPEPEPEPQGKTVVIEDRSEPAYIRNKLTERQVETYHRMGTESLRHLIRHMSQFGFYAKYEEVLDQIEAEFNLAKEDASAFTD